MDRCHRGGAARARQRAEFSRRGRRLGAPHELPVPTRRAVQRNWRADAVARPVFLPASIARIAVFVVLQVSLTRNGPKSKIACC
jgi:hypothetical protein